MWCVSVDPVNPAGSVRRVKGLCVIFEVCGWRCQRSGEGVRESKVEQIEVRLDKHGWGGQWFRGIEGRDNKVKIPEN